jgi:NADH-quinone oxidoreductase subunit K
MNPSSAYIFWHFGIFIVLVGICGIYCLLATLSLVRAIIGIEILMKAVTLLLILAGYLTGYTAFMQSLVITLIVIEVTVMVVAAGIILWVFRHHQTIDPHALMDMKG